MKFKGFRGIVEQWLGTVLAKIPPEVVLDYIENGKDPAEDALKYFPEQVMFARSLAKPFLGLAGKIRPQDVLKFLREKNPETAGVIMNHPDGMEWLKETMTRFKDLMLAKEVVCDRCLNPFPLYPLGRERYTCPYCGTEYEF